METIIIITFVVAMLIAFMNGYFKKKLETTYTTVTGAVETQSKGLSLDKGPLAPPVP